MIVMLLVLSIAPFFKGLFFEMELQAFFISILVVVFLYLFTKLLAKEKIRYNRWLVSLGGLLVLSNLISFIQVINIRSQINSLMQYIEFFMIIIIMYDYFHDQADDFEHIFMPLYILVGSVCAVIGLIPSLGKIQLFGDYLVVDELGSRIGSTFQYPNTAAIYFVLCIMFASVLIHTSKHIIIKAIWAVMGNILFMALLHTSSRGAFLVGSIAFFIFLLLQPHGYKVRNMIFFIIMTMPVLLTATWYTPAVKNGNLRTLLLSLALPAFVTLLGCLIFGFLMRMPIHLINILNWVAILFVILLFGGVIVLFFFFHEKALSFIPLDMFQRLSTTNFSDTNLQYRLTFSRDAMKIIAEHWLFGVGAGGWTALYQGVQDTFYTARDTHNHYLELFIELGLLGILSYLAIVVYSLINFIRSLVILRKHEHYVPVLGMFCVFMTLVLHSAIDFDFSYMSLYMVFWLMVAAAAASVANKKKGTESEDVAPKKIRTGLVSKVVLLILCAVLIPLNGLFLLASYYAHEGENNLEKLDYTASMLSYVEANRLDPINPEYPFELSKLYAFFAKNNKNPEYVDEWNLKARENAKISVLLNRYYPPYREALARAFMQSGMPIQALDELQKLVSYQRCNIDNYALLATGYLDVAAFHIAQGNKEAAKSDLQSCIEIEKADHVTMTPNVLELTKKASEMLAEMKIYK